MRFAISISARHKGHNFDFLRHEYVPFFEKIGLMPIVVPNVLADPCAYVTALDVSGVILTGGGDIAPDRYGQANRASRAISSVRDHTETQLLQMAVERHMPVLGICRGIQAINVFFGGSLVQDIPTEIGRAIDHDDEKTGSHTITIVDPRIERLLGTQQITVNTHHHQGVTRRTLAPDLEVFAVCEQDGIIEGVLHRTLPILGVQWHPERLGPSEASDIILFRRFLQGELWPLRQDA